MLDDVTSMLQWSAEKQLALLKACAERCSDSLVVATFESVIVYANPKFSSLAQMRFEDLAGSKLDQCLSREDRERLEVVVKPMLRANRSWRGDFVLEGCEGRVVPVTCSVSYLPANDNHPEMFAAFMSDEINVKAMTEELVDQREGLEGLVARRTKELKNANEELTLQIQRFESTKAVLQRERDFSMDILNRTPAIICGIDAQGLTSFLNPAGQQITGYSAEEIRGKNWWKTFYPEALYEQVEKLFTLFSDGDVQNHQMTLRNRNGNEHLISWNSINTYDADGRLKDVVGVGYDMTEQVRAQELLRVSEEKYRALYHESHDAYMITSIEKGFVDCNEATVELFGCRDLAHFTMFSPSALSPEFQPDGSRSDEKALRMMTMALQNGSNYFEWRHRKVSGEEFDAMVLLNRLNFTEEPLLQATVRDITEFLHMQERLRHIEKLDSVGKLAGGVAHDFNNMLGGISGAAELLEARIEDPSLRELVDIIRDASDRASELTRKLLTFSRKGNTPEAVFDVHNSMREALSILDRSIDRRIVSNAHLDATWTTVVGDSNQLQNAILNLGLNARDAMPDGGQITFSTRNVRLDEEFCQASEFDVAPGPYIEIKVEDLGMGIDSDVLPHVFEPFFTTKEVGKGTGLGLSAVYGTIKDHRGSISVSTELGAGTSFKIHLPVNRAALEERTSRPGSITSGQGTVLLVDDEEIIRLMGTAMLESLGYTVILACDGADAISIYGDRMNEIDAVVLDMVMPNVNGSDTFRALKKINDQVKVIFCSGFSREQCVDDLIDEGAVAFLQKPYKKSELSNALNGCN